MSSISCYDLLCSLIKRWFLYSPSNKPSFNPNTSTLDWLHNDYPSLPVDRKPLECVLHPGEVSDIIPSYLPINK